MEKHRVKGSKILGESVLPILTGLILWFIAEGFLIYTPFADRYAFRDIVLFLSLSAAGRLRYMWIC